jgi:hypothetical protein
LRPRDEEPDRVGLRHLFDRGLLNLVHQPERRHRVLAFARDPEPDSTRDETRQTGTGGQQVGHEWRCLDQLLEVVEEHQEALVTEERREPLIEWLISCLAYAEGLRN